ncbi:hypothetical protein ACTXT7_017573 [Hymenolepis weldensis]
MRSKRLLNRLKHPEEQECLWFFSEQKKFHQDEKSMEEMTGGYVQADLTEVPTVMHAHEFASNSGGFRCCCCGSGEGHIMTPQLFPQGLRVNVDADADADVDATVETLQTIFVKSPWIDNVANGGRPNAFHQDSAPSNKALNTQDWMDG